MSKTTERRELKFSNLDEVVAEVERLASGEVRTTGSHSFGKIIEHLARTHDMATGKVQAPSPPWYMKIGLFFMKGSLLKDKPLAPGFNLPADAEAFFWPDQEIDVAVAVPHFKDSVENYKANFYCWNA